MTVSVHFVLGRNYLDGICYMGQCGGQFTIIRSKRRVRIKNQPDTIERMIL